MAIYNSETKKIREYSDCATCEYWDKILKKCNGYDKKCFEYDLKTRTIIDGKTKLSRKV